MVRRFLVPRVCLGLALAVVAVPVGLSGAQDNGLASITIYTSVCPPDYAAGDYYADCYWTPGSGYTFDLVGPGYAGGGATTGPSGFAAFEGIDQAGTYVLTQTAPADVFGYDVVCSAGGAPFPLAYVEGGVRLDLTTSDDLRCDWFNVPVGPHTNGLASITIYTAVCPTDYAGSAFFADCFGTPGGGYTFALAGPGGAAEATSGPAGIAFFEGLATAGSYAVTQVFPGDSAGRAVFCGEAGVAHDVALVAGGFVLDLTVDDDVRCDWYVVPSGAAPAAPPTSPPADPTSTPEPEPTPTATPTPIAAPPRSSDCPDAEEWALLALINDYREENGLAPLTLSATLTAAAEYHSQEMATFDYFSHTLRGGVTATENMIVHGYTYDTARGENIATGNSSAQATFEQWVNSAPHRANVLSPNYTAVGIGRAYNPDSTYKWYWTADFGGYADAAVSC